MQRRCRPREQTAAVLAAVCYANVQARPPQQQGLRPASSSTRLAQVCGGSRYVMPAAGRGEGYCCPGDIVVPTQPQVILLRSCRGPHVHAAPTGPSVSAVQGLTVDI